MTTDRLPPADPFLVARTTAALPARLQAKVDVAVAAAGTWVITGSVVHLPGGAEVVLSPSADGVLRLPEQVVCACLLAPGCLHRAGVLAAAPVALDSGEGSGNGGPGEPSSVGETETASAEEVWTVPEQETAEVLRAAADALALSVREGALGRLTVERTDGTGVLVGDAPLAAALEAAGFRATPKGLRIRA